MARPIIAAFKSGGSLQEKEDAALKAINQQKPVIKVMVKRIWEMAGTEGYSFSQEIFGTSGAMLAGGKSAQNPLSNSLKTPFELPPLEAYLTKAAKPIPAWMVYVADYVDKDTGKKIKWIGDGEKKELQQQIFEGIQKEEGVPKITKRVEAMFTDMPPWKAKRIAQSEVIESFNMATLQQSIDAGSHLDRIWIATEDNKTRDAHRDMDLDHGGIAIPWDQEEGFDCDDGTNWPGEAVNCRCALGSAVPGKYPTEKVEEDAPTEEPAPAEAPAAEPEASVLESDALNDMNTSSEMMTWNDEHAVYAHIDDQFASRAEADVLRDYIQTTDAYLTNNNIDIPETSRFLNWREGQHAGASGGVNGINLGPLNVERKSVNFYWQQVQDASSEHNLATTYGRFAQADQAKLTNIHELGHVFEGNISKEDRKLFDALWETLPRDEQKDISVYALTRLTGRQAEFYGVHGEGFAESQLLYVTGHADLIPSALSEFFKNIGLVEGSVPLEVL